jgi:bifunctional non-homologous end joining protein LigD
MSLGTSSSAVTVAGVRITHPERVLFEEMGLTKQALAEYYEAVAEHLLPDLRNRPLSLVRCPQGPDEGCFFQKHIDKAWSSEIERATVPESDGEGIYAVANSAAALVGLVQKGVIELHVMGATTRALDKPDRVVFDLDPDAGVPWREVIAATRLTRDVLEGAGLETFLKTSGGKGLHVVVPLAPRHDWDEVKEFARAVAQKLADDAPKRFTAKMAKSERTGRIFIDWLRNAPGATTVAAYSVRARKGAPVSTPLHWEELKHGIVPRDFTMEVALKRCAEHGDLFAPVLDDPRPLAAAARALAKLG